MSGWHLTANEINQWTTNHRRDAQGILPLFVRKLIVFSLSPASISMPAGDSILTGGWDGVLQVGKGSLFVPEGQSVWEFGTTGKSIRAKADKDYLKRSEDPLGLIKSESTFIFATSRTFADLDQWLAGKSEQTEWKQVRALNAYDLELWLEQCPPVHRWFARLLGKRPPGAWDFDQAWDNWRCATKPACNVDLALGGRTEPAAKLCNQLRGSAAVHRVRAESSDEAYAFVLADGASRAATPPQNLDSD